MTSPTFAATTTTVERPDAHALLRTAARERALRDAAIRIASQPDPDALLSVALDIVAGLVQLDVAALFLTTEEAQPAACCRAVRRRGVTHVLTPNGTPEDAFAADALRTPTLNRSDSWSPPGGPRCQAALALPLEAQGVKLGVLVVGRYARAEWRDDHVALVSAVAQLLAPALWRQRQDQRRVRLLSMASHEMRTPLSALRGFTEIMLAGGVSRDDQASWLAIMNEEAIRLSGLIDELSDLTRSQAGDIKLKPALIQVAEVVSRVVRLLDAGGGRVRLLIEPAPTVLADDNKLEQVVTNLLRNACDYSPVGRPVEVEVAGRCLAEPYHPVMIMNGQARLEAAHNCSPTVSVVVRDEGAGLTPDELAQACQPFFRGQASQELAPTGSGLGLAISKAIIERHYGQLWAHSRPGAGSAFGFCLPPQPAAPATN